MAITLARQMTLFSVGTGNEPCVANLVADNPRVCQADSAAISSSHFGR